MTSHRNFIDGKFVDTPGAERIGVTNPARGTRISDIPDTPAAMVGEAIAAARRAQPAWAKKPAIERAGHLRRIAAKLREHTDEIARIITEEQGKLLDLAKIEAAFTADFIDYMAEWARRIEGEIVTSDRPGENIFLFRQPIGVIGGILPWNFPFFLIARKMAPALVTGNTIVIKPSEETPNNAAKFAEIVAQTDLPPGVFNIVYGRGATTGHALASDPRIGMVSFTGSVETGSKIMATAAANITKVNLELGGKAPAIVMPDANLDLAVKAIRDSRVINSGQVCNCAERIYVHRKIAPAFLEKFVAAMRATTWGDPLGDKPVGMGPLVNATQARKVEAAVGNAVKAGASVVTGGKLIEEGGGYYFEPTVITDTRQDMDIMQREIFGPVAPLHLVDSLDEAIEKANDSVYGLTSSIYTSDIASAMRACNELKFGETYINRENFEAMQGFHAGQRRSGIGGADGKHGLYEYTTSHMVYLQT